jgi:hypothetical protein
MLFGRYGRIVFMAISLVHKFKFLPFEVWNWVLCLCSSFR